MVYKKLILHQHKIHLNWDQRIKNYKKSHTLIRMADPCLDKQPDFLDLYNYSRLDNHYMQMQLFDVVLVDIQPVFLLALSSLAKLSVLGQT